MTDYQRAKLLQELWDSMLQVCQDAHYSEPYSAGEGPMEAVHYFKKEDLAAALRKVNWERVTQ